MAVAPVTDQRYYDTIYSERYMGLPQDNPEAYRLASPVTFADSLRGRLLLVHGSGDDNVHFQNSEAVINALVAADKPFSDDGLSQPHPLHLRGPQHRSPLARPVVTVPHRELAGRAEGLGVRGQEHRPHV